MFRSDHYPNLRYWRAGLLGGREWGAPRAAEDRPRPERQQMHDQPSGRFKHDRKWRKLNLLQDFICCCTNLRWARRLELAGFVRPIFNPINLTGSHSYCCFSGPCYELRSLQIGILTPPGKILFQICKISFKTLIIGLLLGRSLTLKFYIGILFILSWATGINRNA